MVYQDIQRNEALAGVGHARKWFPSLESPVGFAPVSPVLPLSLMPHANRKRSPRKVNETKKYDPGEDERRQEVHRRHCVIVHSRLAWATTGIRWQSGRSRASEKRRRLSALKEVAGVHRFRPSIYPLRGMTSPTLLAGEARLAAQRTPMTMPKPHQGYEKNRHCHQTAQIRF